MASIAALLFARIWSNLCAIGTFIIVSHFIGPAEFGMFALASSIAVLPQWLVGVGAYEYILGRDPTGRHQDTAWTLSALSGIAAAALLLAIGAAIAVLFGQAEAYVIFGGFAVTTLMWGLCATHEAALIRDGRGGAVAGVGAAAESMAVGALLLALLAGAGVYALIASRVVLGIVNAAGYWLTARMPIRIRIDAAEMREIGRFGSGVVATRVVGWGHGYGTDVIIGSMLNLADVGLYRMGMRIQSAATAVLLQAPGSPILAALGKALARGAGRMRHMLRRILILQLALTLPLFAGLAASAELIIDLALPPLWQESGIVLLLACLRTPGMILQGLVAAALTAHGRSRTVFLLLLASTPPLFAAMLLGALSSPSLVSGLMTIVALATGAVSVWAIPGLPRGGALALLALAARISLAAFAMFGTCYELIAVTAGLSMPWRIVIAANVLLLGLVLYALLLRLVAPEAYRLLRHLAMPGIAWGRERLRGRRTAT
jgi:O-antigen/teichoic acid export membrane protein